MELFVSLKYLGAKRRQTFISIITVISIAGVAIGVLALIIVLSVMGGFEKDLRERILGTTAHITVLSLKGHISDYEKILEKVRETDGVLSATPFLYTQVLVTGPGGSSGAVMRGIDVETAKESLKISQFVRVGSLDSLVQEGNVPGIVLGRELADNIGAVVGDTVEVLVPGGKISPFGPLPEVRSFRVVGLFESGMFDFDSGFAFVSLPEAQKALLLGKRVSGIEVKVEDIYDAGKIASSIQSKLGFPFIARDWMRMNRNLFSALKLEKVVMFIILVLIVFVAAFNIVSTLIMVVMEKTKDIAILMSMGVRRKSIRKIFALEGLIIGVVGTAIGQVLGYISCFLLKKYQFIKLPSDVYYISTLPVEMNPLTFLVTGVAAVAICYLATVYPANQAAKIDPAEALRYE
ncbi:MAG: lipoprotein-releasing ABC transporter permease subunit [Deltaproteobacteria bacterium]|nr:MAG: lipoprotein-releasing ABC transporter permease subunit [Deltaproteobacteria bacterium]